MFKRSIITALLAIAAVLGLALPALAGGTGNFYYGPKYTATVCGFYGQATNYYHSGGQQYHWAFKSVDSGYQANGVEFLNSSGTLIKTSGGLGVNEGYTNFSSPTADYTLRFVLRSGSGGICYASILYSAWR